MQRNTLLHGSSVILVPSLLTLNTTKSNMREGLMDPDGKPHVGTNVSGQGNYGHVKKVRNVKTYSVNRN